MQHLEPVEPRRLFAAGPDSAFGTAGHVALPGRLAVGSIGLLATHGGVYVRGFSKSAGRWLIYKYTDAGTLDTAWGLGGHQYDDALPRSLQTAEAAGRLAWAYDAHTHGLLLSAGYADVHAGTVAVERLTAAGVADTAWGTGGRVTFTRNKAILAEQTLTPLTHERLLVGLQTVEQRGPADANGHSTAGGEADVELLRYDRLGRSDRTFGTRGELVVSRGHYKSAPADAGYRTVNASVPALTDTAVQADGSVRAIVVRSQSATLDQIPATSGPDTDVAHQTGHVRQTVETWVATDDDRLRPTASAAYALSTVSNDDPQQRLAAYTVYEATATGDGGVRIVATDTKDHAVLTRFAPDTRPTVTTLGSGLVYDLYTGTAGDVYVRTFAPPADAYVVLAYAADGRTDAGFADHGTLTDAATAADLASVRTATGDDAGRLLTVEGDRVLTRYR